MTERLPRDIHDRLTRAIWDLGRASMSYLVSIAPTPSYVKGELELDDEVLEPEFLITDPEAFQNTLPNYIALTISSMEEYAKDPDFTMYSWHKIAITTRNRSREYSKGIVLFDGEGSAITPNLDLPTLGSRRRPGTKAWRELHDGSNIQTFDVETAREFIETSERFRVHVVDNDNM